MRLRVAICDDSAVDRVAIRTALDGYLRAREIEAEVFEFARSEALLESLVRRRFDLYLLDVVMPAATGIDVMRKVRASDRRAEVVFFSTSREYALEAFGVQAINYLVKPWTSADFTETLTRALSGIECAEGRALSIKTPGGVRRISLEEIVCVTSSAMHNFLSVRLMDGSILETRQTMAAFRELIDEDGRFFFAGRVAVINPRAVRSVDGTKVRLISGNYIEIPRSCVGAIKQAVLAL